MRLRYIIALLISISIPMLSYADWKIVSKEDVPESTLFVEPQSEPRKSPVGTMIYVSNYFGGTVSEIDAECNSVIKTITVGEFPEIPVFSPDGTIIYVSHHFSRNISLIDAKTN